MSKFKVGDKVFSLQYGWGKIQEIDTLHGFMRALMVDTCVVYPYCIDGRINALDVAPSLLTVEEAAALGHFRQTLCKKWRWVVREFNTDNYCITGGHFNNQAEYNKLECPSFQAWILLHKIPETEIEGELYGI